MASLPPRSSYEPQPVVLFELVKGMVTGNMPELGKMHRVGPSH